MERSNAPYASPAGSPFTSRRTALAWSSTSLAMTGSASRSAAMAFRPASVKSGRRPVVERVLRRAELGGGRVAEKPLAGDPVPVGGCAELAEHAERERLHAAREHRLRRHGLAAHQLPVARARVAEVDQHLADQLALDGHLAVLYVPAGDVVEVVEHRLRRDLVVGRVVEPHRAELAVEALDVAVHAEPDRRDLGLQVLP